MPDADAPTRELAKGVVFLGAKSVKSGKDGGKKRESLMSTGISLLGGKSTKTPQARVPDCLYLPPIASDCLRLPPIASECLRLPLIACDCL